MTIVPPGRGCAGAEIMTLAYGEPGDATGASATLGGAAITGDTPWDGTVERPARRSDARDQPDRQGHHRRHHQDP